MKISESVKEALLSVGIGLTIITWIALLSKFVVPYLMQFGLFGGMQYTAFGVFVLTCIVTPFWEEAFYRYVPFEIMKKVNDFTKQDFSFITIILTSIVFALAHVNNGILAILFQGVGGLLLGLLYTSTKRSYLNCVIAHSIWNLSALYILPLL